jgi:hypothetical protein
MVHNSPPATIVKVRSFRVIRIGLILNINGDDYVLLTSPGIRIGTITTTNNTIKLHRRLHSLGTGWTSPYESQFIQTSLNPCHFRQTWDDNYTSVVGIDIRFSILAR